MKWLLLLLAMCFIIFGCKNKHHYSDEITKGLASKKVPEWVGEKMKRHFKDSGKAPTTYNFDWKVYNDLISGGYDDVYLMPIRYSKNEEQYYRDAFNIPPGDPRGDVDGYSSFIIQVGTNTDYYQFAKFCPPPDTCP